MQHARATREAGRRSFHGAFVAPSGQSFPMRLGYVVKSSPLGAFVKLEVVE